MLFANVYFYVYSKQVVMGSVIKYQFVTLVGLIALCVGRFRLNLPCRGITCPKGSGSNDPNGSTYFKNMRISTVESSWNIKRFTCELFSGVNYPIDQHKIRLLAKFSSTLMPNVSVFGCCADFIMNDAIHERMIRTVGYILFTCVSLSCLKLSVDPSYLLKDGSSLTPNVYKSKTVTRFPFEIYNCKREPVIMYLTIDSNDKLHRDNMIFVNKLSGSSKFRKVYLRLFMNKLLTHELKYTNNDTASTFYDNLTRMVEVRPNV